MTDHPDKRIVKELFAQALELFREKYVRDRKAAIEALRPEIGKTTIEKLLGIKAKKEGEGDSEPAMLAVIDLMIPEKSPRLYHRLGRAIGQSPREVDSIITKLQMTTTLSEFDAPKTDFRYYRFLNERGGDNDYSIVAGRIVIEVTSGIATFTHYLGVNEDQLHSGFAYLRNDRLTMFGWRNDVLRMAIVTIPGGDWNPNTHIFQGGLISVTKTQRDPYLARCVLVQRGHKLFDQPPDEDALKKAFKGMTSGDHGFMGWH